MLKEKWKSIHDAIDQDIRNGVLQPGDRLPPEPELVRKFDTGRHSVRRAISELAKNGKLSVEQGRGTFVEAAPRLTYTIGKRTRLRNLSAQGIDLTRQFLGGGIVPATQSVAEALRVAEGDPVIQNQRLSLADGSPLSFGRAFHDANRFPDYLERREVLGSVTATYASYGIDDYLRGETMIYSRRAKGDEARTLRQHPDQPVMVVRAVDTMLDGTPIGYSQVIWSSVRVRFVITHDDEGEA